MITTVLYFVTMIVMVWVLVLNFIKIGEYRAKGLTAERHAMIASTLVNLFVITTLIMVRHFPGV